MVVRCFTCPYNNIMHHIKTNANIYNTENNKDISVSALWDTGASCSCISHDVVKNLNLLPISKIPINTPSGNSIADVFVVNIKLPNDIIIENVKVCDSEIGTQQIGLLVGMDIISQGDFAISNFNKNTVFSFRYPAYKNIDFVSEARKDDLLKHNSHGNGKRKK